MYKNIVLFAAIVCVMFLLLIIGPPQSSKWIFMFQAYVYPGNFEALLEPESTFTGIWKTWWPSGVIQSVTSYKNGLKHGVEYIYDDKGACDERILFLKGNEILVSYYFMEWHVRGTDNKIPDEIIPDEMKKLLTYDHLHTDAKGK